jgi:hypothetical protein
MKRSLLILLLLMPLVALCDNKDKKKKKLITVSRWREITRFNTDSVAIPFTDTLFISFVKNDSFFYHNKNGFVYRGPYIVSEEDSTIDFGYYKYRITQKKPNSLVLKSNTGTYAMVPDWSDTLKDIVVPKDEKIIPVTNVDVMIGRWSVYKRTSEQSVSSDGNDIIRSVYITGPSSDGKLGVVFSSKDPANVPSWYIKGFGADQVLVCEGRTNKSLKVIKCQNDEMILEDSGVKYYFKQYK